MLCSGVCASLEYLDGRWISCEYLFAYSQHPPAFLTCYTLSYVDEAQDNLLIDALGTLPLITMTIH